MRELGNRIRFDDVTLACDVGGTNTSLAVVGRLGRRFDILQRYRFRSNDLNSLQDALDETLAVIHRQTPHLAPTAISVSGAGPVTDQVCRLSNVSWDIDGGEIASRTGVRTLILNDFTAISYGIPLLDVDDADQITVLEHPDGTTPRPSGAVQLVVGAGTGLGVGYLVEHGDRFLAFPSEGGHSYFAAVSEEDHDLAAFVGARTREFPGAEQFVSGQGIANIAAWFRHTGRIPASSDLSGEPITSEDTARAVSEAALAGDSTAADIMRRFVRLYAQFAASAALFFFPTAGLFLAGGIVTKNERWFVEDNAFMTTFLRNYRENIAAALRGFPVYLVKDYAISLYGAAHAAYSLLDDPMKG